MNWQKYTLDNESNVNEFSLFVKDMVNELQCKSVLEVGCNVGHNLRELKGAHGLDIDFTAVKKAMNYYPQNNFYEGDILTSDFTWHGYNFVFTRAVLSHINNSDIEQAMTKIYNAAGRYIMTCEYYDDSYKEIPWRDEIVYCRNYVPLWEKFPVKIIRDTWLWNDPMKLRMVLCRVI